MTVNELLNVDERADYDAFVVRVRRLTGVDLSQYREQQTHRRLRSLVERSGYASFSDYATLLEEDAEAIPRFLDRLTINVSELFRDPDKWTLLRERVLPSLLQGGRPLRIWSAGCSVGAEPYSLAMVLADMGEGARHRILATDIDRAILDRAREASYSEQETRYLPERLRSKYLQKQEDGRYRVLPEVAGTVELVKHDLLRDPFAEGFDLIICRNVVIYFTDNAKDALYRRFVKSLRTGGVLFVGGSERTQAYRDLGLSTDLSGFYEKCRPVDGSNIEERVAA